MNIIPKKPSDTFSIPTTKLRTDRLIENMIKKQLETNKPVSVMEGYDLGPLNEFAMEAIEKKIMSQNYLIDERRGDFYAFSLSEGSAHNMAAPHDHFYFIYALDRRGGTWSDDAVIHIMRNATVVLKIQGCLLEENIRHFLIPPILLRPTDSLDFSAYSQSGSCVAQFDLNYIIFKVRK